MTKQIALLLLTLSLSCGRPTQPQVEAIARTSGNRVLRDKIARLLNEGNIQFRRERYAHASGLYNEVCRLDPGNRKARVLADLADRAYSLKLADDGRREVIETWLRLTEPSHQYSLPQTQLVRYASEQAWHVSESTCWAVVFAALARWRAALFPGIRSGRV